MSGLDLEPVETWARGELDRKNAAREQALRWSRELVRTCANSIRAIHRHELASAEALLGEAHALNDQIRSVLAFSGKALRRVVHVQGQRSGGYLVDSLVGGESVITAGPADLQDGQKIRIKGQS